MKNPGVIRNGGRRLSAWFGQLECVFLVVIRPVAQLVLKPLQTLLRGEKASTLDTDAGDVSEMSRYRDGSKTGMAALPSPGRDATTLRRAPDFGIFLASNLAVGIVDAIASGRLEAGLARTPRQFDRLPRATQGRQADCGRETPTNVPAFDDPERTLETARSKALVVARCRAERKSVRWLQAAVPAWNLGTARADRCSPLCGCLRFRASRLLQASRLSPSTGDMREAPAPADRQASWKIEHAPVRALPDPRSRHHAGGSRVGFDVPRVISLPTRQKRSCKASPGSLEVQTVAIHARFRVEGQGLAAARSLSSCIRWSGTAETGGRPYVTVGSGLRPQDVPAIVMKKHSYLQRVLAGVPP